MVQIQKMQLLKTLFDCLNWVLFNALMSQEYLCILKLF